MNGLDFLLDGATCGVCQKKIKSVASKLLFAARLKLCVCASSQYCTLSCTILIESWLNLAISFSALVSLVNVVVVGLLRNKERKRGN